MAKPPPKGESDPMARVVDQLLAQLPGLHGSHDPSPGVVRRAVPETSSGWSPPSIKSGRGPGVLGLCARIVLVLALAVMMIAWPYDRTCGFPLFGYFGAVGVVILGGGWTGITAWKLRVALAHVVALVLVFWGLVLASDVVLPRIGYAGQEASWQCEDVD